MIKKKNTLVWQISKPSTDQFGSKSEDEEVSYLIGTMHVRDERAFQFEKIFFEKLEACAIFATEFDLEDAQMDLVQEAMCLSDFDSLKKLIPNKLYARIDSVLRKQAGVPLFYFDRFKPLAVTNFLTEKILSNDRMLSLDETLWHYAKEKGKILRGIETFEEQLIVLQKMTFDEQLKGLKDTARNFTKFRKQLLRMANLYEQADISKIYKAAKHTARGGRQMLLYNRNEIMANRIAEMMNENTVCAAIGAGHFGGKKGVLRLLKLKGFEVKPCF